jgi:hypothetical protein
MITNAKKIKRHDKIELLCGKKEVSYLIHYPKSEVIQIVYTDNTFFYCGDFEDVEVIKGKKMFVLLFSENTFIDYDNPKKYNVENILNKAIGYVK